MTPSMVPVRLEILTKRADFLAIARAKSTATNSLVLQARQRETTNGAGIRVGYTCSKKLGGAVLRNRAKRRLREVARAILPANGRPGWDYVLIGRADRTISLPFAQMKTDWKMRLRIHQSRLCPNENA